MGSTANCVADPRIPPMSQCCCSTIVECERCVKKMKEGYGKTCGSPCDDTVANCLDLGGTYANCIGYNSCANAKDGCTTCDKITKRCVNQVCPVGQCWTAKYPDGSGKKQCYSGDIVYTTADNLPEGMSNVGATCINGKEEWKYTYCFVGYTLQGTGFDARCVKNNKKYCGSPCDDTVANCLASGGMQANCIGYNSCASATDGCTICDKVTKQCKPEPKQCGIYCITDADCAGLKGCDKCDKDTKLCTPELKQCPTHCIKDADCAGPEGLCNSVCNTNTKSCMSKPKQCASYCITDADCAGFEGCNKCDKNTKQCKPEPTVACLTNTDCTLDAYCKKNSCTATTGICTTKPAQTSYTNVNYCGCKADGKEFEVGNATERSMVDLGALWYELKKGASCYSCKTDADCASNAYCMEDGKCGAKKCPVGSSPTGTGGTTDVTGCKCPKGTGWFGNNCVDKIKFSGGLGYHADASTAYMVWNGSEFELRIYSCTGDYVLNGDPKKGVVWTNTDNVCIPPSLCPEGQIANIDKKCVPNTPCKVGYVRNDYTGQCLKNPGSNCAEAKVTNASANGYSLTCVECEPGYAQSTSYGQKLCYKNPDNCTKAIVTNENGKTRTILCGTCASGYALNGYTGQCLKNPGSNCAEAKVTNAGANGYSLSCVKCEPGYAQSTNYGQKLCYKNPDNCTTATVINDNGKTRTIRCNVCAPGYYQDSAGQCLRKRM